jgi:NitT/TauT family transport system substrate-binding protein
MALIQTRRNFISGIAGAATAGLVRAPRAAAEEGILETTTVRLEKDPGICRAPQYVAEALLRAEGFTDIRHVKRGSSAEINEALAKKQADFGTHYNADLLTGRAVPRPRSSPGCMSAVRSCLSATTFAALPT